jgi:hypothetical protein
MMHTKILAVVVGVLVLTAVRCSKARVELVDHGTSAPYLGYKDDPYPSSGRTWYWQEVCAGRVTNMGNRIAYKVRVSIRFGRGGVDSALINGVNLEPGEVASFSFVGDTVSVSVENRYLNPYRPSDPSVTASISLSWE